MSDNKYHDLDNQVSREISTSLIADGIVKYPVRCTYCDQDGLVQSDNNWPIGACPICKGTKKYMVAV